MGGAAGHMGHLHENIWMTFAELKSFLQQVASAELSPIEKVDGQNIFWRWSPQGIITARNTGDIGKGGMTEEQYMAKWENHPAQGPFVNGYNAIKNAVSRLSDSELTSIFETGQPNTFRYVNTEIMYPESENIIVYDGNYIVLHNMTEYAPVGKNGKMTVVQSFSKGDTEFDSLVSVISDEQKSQDAKEWQVFGPRFVDLKNMVDNEAYGKLISIIGSMGYSDSDKLEDVVKDTVSKELNNSGIPAEKIDLLSQRLVDLGNKLETSEITNLNLIKKGLTPEQKKLVSSIGTGSNARKFIGRSISPLVKGISDFAIETLRGLHSFFMTDGDSEVARMRSTLEDSIARLEAYDGDDSEKMSELLETQLTKLGDIENIASTVEGLVFEYPPGSKNLVKLTGSFAMANQIIGRAKRIPASKPAETKPADAFENFSYSLKELDMLYEAIGNQAFDSIAIIGGAFKPPHLGHLSMVDHYSALADKVIVYISNPKGAKAQRTIAGNAVSPDQSKQLWDLLASGRQGVEILVSDKPSPITIAFDSVMEPNPKTGHPGTPYEPGTTIYLGASDKGGDYKRFSGALKKASPTITVADPAANAAPAAELPMEYTNKLNNSQYALNIPSVIKGRDPKDFSASDFRFLLEQAQTDPVAKDLAGYFVGHDKIDRFMAILGLSSLTENRKLSKYSLRRYLT